MPSKPYLPGPYGGEPSSHSARPPISLSSPSFAFTRSYLHCCKIPERVSEGDEVGLRPLRCRDVQVHVRAHEVEGTETAGRPSSCSSTCSCSSRRDRRPRVGQGGLAGSSALAPTATSTSFGAAASRARSRRLALPHRNRSPKDTRNILVLLVTACFVFSHENGDLLLLPGIIEKVLLSPYNSNSGDSPRARQAGHVVLYEPAYQSVFV